MRYESFYPFAGNQTSQVPMNHYNQYGVQLPQQFGPPSAQQFQGEQMGNQFTQTSQGRVQNNSKMEMYMQTANQFLNTAQQFAPLVQQMAPMFQNLPAMWRLYKGFQSLPSAGAGAGAAATAATAASNAASASTAGFSNPRVFQPPN